MKRTPRRAYLALGGLVLVGSLAFAACGPSTPATAPKPSPSATATQLPQVLAILDRVESANMRDAHVNINASANTQNGNVSTMSTGAMTFNPFQADLMTTGTYLAQPLNAEEVVSGDTLWVKSADSSTWHAYSLDQLTASSAIDPSSFSPAQLVALANARLVGTETNNGVQVYHLQASGTKTISQLTGAGALLGSLGSDTNQPVTYTADLYVRTDNYLPVEFQAHATATGTTADVTAIFSAWNMGVTITPPPAS